MDIEMIAEVTLPMLKVITVDDSRIVSERLKALLSEIENVKFSGNAGNIRDALTLIDQEKPNVVILDILLEEDLPKANGMDLLITLRAKYPDMKIIMLTNLTEPQYSNTCFALGADYFFDKSNDFDKIAEALNEIQL